ncbi:alpha/beta hydrolase [Methylicorpusculum sp.]|uniref:alpha/beta hydrolase n=1 Tax=Methylicorpusculum sp. TaxID=2713644 RepID=UPI00271762AC|nr:alpha/beta hydrolase [Methylicorpusculum sp.]MDO8845275.1 alpha/beta hydrolase [Methylicorpusculum sp.]MDP2177637.1 alpha/beta hydrolase [Methylicorpusculum sp.]MDP3529151.1 alpha/beta hydrolase [Methylicorpusculum sp.]MDZ4152755.1 alpha/beta hydrolase [Methylicorpusculum sp.]
MTVIKRMLSILLPYLLLLLAVFLLQRNLVYFPEKHSTIKQQELADQLNLKRWPSADTYLGLMSKSLNPNYKGTVIVFHGNAGSALDRSYYFDALEKLDYRVIVAEYPGYGAREGAPSEPALLANGLETVKMALADFGGPVFLWGESLGSGVVGAIVKSGQVPIKGIVLMTPFDSLANVAQHHYWFLLAKWLIRDKFNTLNNLHDYSGNTAVLMAEDDQIIPNKNSLKLFNSLPHHKRLWTFKNAGHNSLPLSPNLPWWQEVMHFVAGEKEVFL